MKNLSNQTRLEIDENSNSKTYWNSKAQEAGFKDIENFLGYFELHSKTPRALFAGKHIELVLALRGCTQEERIEYNPFYFFVSARYGTNIDKEFYQTLRNRVNDLE